MKAEIIFRRKTTTENTNWALSVYDKKLCFCKNAQTNNTFMQCSYARLLSIDGSGHLSEVNLNNFVLSLTWQVISWKLAPVFGVKQVGTV